MRSGEHGWNLKRAINNRMGLTAANDKLPKALLEPYKQGGSAGISPDTEGCFLPITKPAAGTW